MGGVDSEFDSKCMSQADWALSKSAGLHHNPHFTQVVLAACEYLVKTVENQ